MKPRLIVGMPSTFLATLVPAGLMNHPSHKQGSSSSMVDLPQGVNLCAHVELTETVDKQGQPVIRPKRCYNPVHAGRHGFLCKMHHDLDYLHDTKKLGKTLERSEEQLRALMQKEVDNARGRDVVLSDLDVQAITHLRSNVSIDYRKYSHWGWATESQDEVSDSEFYED